MTQSYPFYDPPYDSPLEDEFALNFVKYAARLDAFEKQAVVETICGPFRIDFIARVDDYVVGIECDGKPYHDRYRDEWRDALLLGSGGVHTIYHFRGSDLAYHLEDCLFIMAQLDPCLFSDRGRGNLELLASEAARSCCHSPSERILLPYPEEAGGPIRLYLAIDRRTSRHPAGVRPFWIRYYAFAIARGGGNLDDLIAAWQSASPQELEEAWQHYPIDGQAPDG